MSPQIHPTALVDAGAELGPDVEVGPFSVIEKGVRIGARTRLMARSYVCQGTTIGTDCSIHIGAVIGHEPQDLTYKGDPTTTIIGDRCTIREHVTIHRATVKDPNPTQLGDDCFLMANSHVAHNCVIGDNTAMAAQVGVAGSTKIGPRGEFGGQSGVVGHIELGEGVRVGAASPVIKSAAARTELWGFPAREKSKALREMAGAARSWKLVEELRDLKKRLRALESDAGRAGTEGS